MNYESQSQDDLLAGDLAGAESPKNMNNILSGGYSKGNFGGAMKFKGPNLISGKKSTPKKEEPKEKSTLGKAATFLGDTFKRIFYKSSGMTHEQSVKALAEDKAKKAQIIANNRVQK
jgi:hypothetical protein